MKIPIDEARFPLDADHLLADLIVLDTEFCLATGANLPKTIVLCFLKEHLPVTEAEKQLHAWISISFFLLIGDRLEPLFGAHSYLSRHRVNQTITPAQACKWLREHLPHYEDYFRKSERDRRTPRR